jgi:hypothetical protein
LKVFTFIRGNDGATDGVDLPDLPLTADLGELGILSHDSVVNAASSPFPFSDALYCYPADFGSN